MNAWRISCWLLFVPLLSAGCLNNRYAKNYVPENNALARQFVRGKPGPVKIIPVTQEDEIVSAMEAGYIPIGTTSTFTSEHCPWVCAIQHAEKVGADLVLIDEVSKGKEERMSIIYLPSMSYSYTSGSAYANAYAPYGGSAYAYGNYRSTTTTTTYNAVPVQTYVSVYEQTAMFMRKGDFEGFYGAVLYCPPPLPDEAADKEIAVTVLAVLEGSAAKKDGLKRGQRVSAVNGKPIKTRADFAYFEDNPQAIRSVTIKQ